MPFGPAGSGLAISHPRHENIDGPTFAADDMNYLRSDLIYALRSLRQQPGFTVAALLTLALGIGATTAIFSVVHGVLLRPLPYAEAERIVAFGQGSPDGQPTQIGAISVANFEDWREQSNSFASMALYSRAQVTVTGLGEAESVPGAQVTPDFFRVFGAEPMIGRTFTADETTPTGPQAIIVSHQFWQDRLGGAADVLGRTLEVSGVARPIVGVTPPGFEFPTGARLYVPVRNSPGCGRGCVYLAGVALLRPGVSTDAARTELVGIAGRLEQEYPDSNTDVSARVVALTEMIVGDVRRALYVMLGAVFMVLLIACANVANLLLVRGAARSSELAVRSALGAGRRRIISQLMTESVVLAVLGGVLGVVLASWSIDLLRVLAPADVPRLDEIRLNATALLFAAGLVVFTAFVFGLLPALRLAGGNVSTVLRSSGRGDVGARRGWGRSAILVAEVALAVLLLLGAGLMTRSLVHMNAIDAGFTPAGVAHFTIGLPSTRYESPEQRVVFVQELQERLAGLPGVTHAGAIMPLPLGPSVYAASFTRTDQQPEPGREPVALLRAMDGNAFAALDISMAAGRAFQPSDRQGSVPVAIINRAAAEQYWPGEDPVGRQIEVGITLGFEEQPRTIIGIAENIRAIDVREAAEAEIMIPYEQAGSGTVSFVVKAADPARVLAAVRGEVRALDAGLPLIRAGTFRELVAAQTASARFFLTLLGIFAALAVVLAAIGIYGVVAFTVTRRSREIGVRMALGARIQEIFRLVVWQGVRPAVAGLLIGLVLAVAGARLLAGLLYGVQPHDPITFVGVTVLLLAVVVLACIVPAGRASRIPPASALRAE
jgi:putative ABC transport system permease protein